jgi:hypothetical protein
MSARNGRSVRFLTTLVAMSLVGVLVPEVAAHATGATVSLFAGGLDNPRGLTFGPDGNLYVAEGGTGGPATTTSAQCAQVVPPVGPYSGGFTSRISRFDMAGIRTTVASGLPSSMTTAATGGFVSGVADLAFLGGSLYGIEGGAGCSHGLVGTVNTIFRVNRDGSTTQVANLSGFLMAHPVANPDPGDFEPDGTWYSMEAVGNRFYAVEPNHAEIDVVNLNGNISRLVDISATLGSITPTSLAFNGQFYLGNLSLFDPTAPPAQVFKMDKDGNISAIKGGLTAVTGVAFHGGQVYALEAFTGFFAPAPFEAGTGKVVRLTNQGQWEDVATGLTFPTAMTFGPDGELYVSNFGFGAPPGAGQIVRIGVPEAD